MLRIALVDDDEKYLALEKEYIHRYVEESGEEFSISAFSNGMDFIADYKPIYDAVFLDISMPLIDGLTIARKLRKVDNKICIIFLTKQLKHAIDGYEVQALDFVIKPVNYFTYTEKLKKISKYVKEHDETTLNVKTEEGYFRLSVSEIYYIEKDKNYLVYHTTRGDIRERGTVENACVRLKEFGFSKCNSGCLVNLRRISHLSATSVTLNGIVLPLSRRKAKEFKEEAVRYISVT